MAMPTTPFFPLELDPRYGASESPQLPTIATSLTDQRIQRRSRGTTQKRVWDLTFTCDPDTLLTLQRHWDAVNGGLEAFPFISPIGRDWYDLAALDGSTIAWGLPIGNSSSVTASGLGYTDQGQDDGTWSVTSALGHNRLPDGTARANDSLLWDADADAVISDDARRVWNGTSSLFIELDGTDDWVQTIDAGQATILAQNNYVYSFYATGSGTLEWQPAVYTAAGALVSLMGTPQTVVLDNTWQRVSATYGGAVGGVQGGFRIGDTGGAGTAARCWVDGFQIERGQTLRGWARPGPSGTWGQIVAQASTSRTELWVSGYGGRVHAVRYADAKQPTVASGVGYSTIKVRLEEDLGAY